MIDTLASGRAHPRRWLALGILLAAEIMDLLDATIVSIAAPTIRTRLHASYVEIQWVAAGYTLAFAAGLITGGRLGDLYGRKKLLLIGVSGFTAASALCAASSSTGMLIGCRLAQGAFAAVMIPQGFGIIKSMFDDSELAAAFGAIGPVMGLATVGGPILGGALIGANLWDLSWRAIFLVNVPIGLATLALAARFVPESRSDQRLSLDITGMLLVTTALGLITFPLVQGRDYGWPAWTFLCIAAGLVVLIGFAVHEVARTRRGRTPLVVPTLFRRRSYSAGLIVGLMFFASMSGLLLIFSIYMQSGLGYSPLRAGLTMVPWSVGIAIGASAAGSALGPRFGRRCLQAGAVTMALGVVGIYLTLRSASIPSSQDLIPALLVTGLGMGLVLAPFFDIVLWGVSANEVGSASGVLNANQQLGSTIGVAVLGTVFFTLLGGHILASSQAQLTPVTSTMAAAHISPYAQTQYLDDLAHCTADTAVAADPATVPQSCQREQGLHLPITADLRHHLSTVAENARRVGFTRTVDLVLWTIVVALLTTALLAQLLPLPEPRPPTPSDQASRRRSSNSPAPSAGAQ